MKQEELEQRILEAARGYNEPPEPPRDEMWTAIRESMAATPQGGSTRSDRWTRPHRWMPWVVGLAAAATLAVGIGLGRLTGPAPAAPETSTSTAASTADRPSLAARMATADHLGEAEVMLTLFRTEDRTENRAATTAWARDLLSTTRLLMDSRVAQDPELAQLLEDLELVLVQIAGAAEDPADQDMIEAGIEQRQILTKLRTAAVARDAAL